MSAPGALHPDPATARRLADFAAAVRASPHNLVSRRARDELEQRHVPECVALASLLPQGSPRVLDVGSGGGFPGLVIAICRPDVELHLLDATAKKTEFLADTAALLGVEVSVHTGRAEDLARRDDLGASFDVVTARAVAPLDRLVPWTIPFLRPGGALYAMKGERWEEELVAATAVLARHGASLLATPDDLAGSVPSGGSSSSATAPRVVMLARST